MQFATEAGRAEALKLNKSELQGAVIAVAPSRFSLIPVAAAASVGAVPDGASSPTADTNSHSGKDNGPSHRAKTYGGDDLPYNCYCYPLCLAQFHH